MLEDFRNKPVEKQYNRCCKRVQAIETVLQALENSIGKDKVEALLILKEMQRDNIYIEFLESDRSDENLHMQGLILDGEIKILKELSEDK